MISDKKTSKAIGNMEVEYEKKHRLTQNMRVVDGGSVNFKQFIELISAARRKKDQEDLEAKERGERSSFSTYHSRQASNKPSNLSQNEEEKEEQKMEVADKIGDIDDALQENSVNLDTDQVRNNLSRMSKEKSRLSNLATNLSVLNDDIK